MKRRIAIPLVLFCVSLAVLGAGAAATVPIHGADTDGYLRHGAELFKWLVQGPDGLVDIDDLFIVPHYIISASLLTAIHSSLGLGDAGVIAFHGVLFALIVCMIFGLWNMIFDVWDRPLGNRPLAVAVAGGLYIVFGLPDGPLWTYAILTEMIFLFWIAAFVYVIVRGFLEERGSMWGIGLFLAAAAPFVRPTGLIVPLLYLFALAVYCSAWLRDRFRIVLAAALVLPLLVVFVAVPWLVALAINGDPLLDEIAPGFLRRGVTQAAVFFQDGIAVEGRVEYAVSRPVSYLEILRMIVVRLVYFWVPLRLGEPPYDTLHNVVNFVYILLTWPLLVVGLKRLLGGGVRLKLAALFLVMVAYGYALLHSVTLVAFDWRYQLPAMVPYWVLAGCGFFHVFDLVMARKAGKEAVTGEV